MDKRIRVALLDDHPVILNGYQNRLEQSPNIQVVATGVFGEQLEPMLHDKQVDVLLLDVQVPVSSSENQSYDIFHLIPKLQEKYPDLVILISSVYCDRNLIKSFINVGASGYILKNDLDTFNKLDEVVRAVKEGEIYFSEQAERELEKDYREDEAVQLTPRQTEMLSYLAAHPNRTTEHVAEEFHVAHSTVRNTLSKAYLRLGVKNLHAALLKARQQGIITPHPPAAPELYH